MMKLFQRKAAGKASDDYSTLCLRLLTTNLSDKNCIQRFWYVGLKITQICDRDQYPEACL